MTSPLVIKALLEQELKDTSKVSTPFFVQGIPEGQTFDIKLISRNGLLYTSNGEEVTSENIDLYTPAIVYNDSSVPEGILYPKSINISKMTAKQIKTVLPDFNLYSQPQRTIDVELTKTFKKGLISVEADITSTNYKLNKDIKNQILNSLVDLNFSKSIREEVGSQVLKAMADKIIATSSSAVSLKAKNDPKLQKLNKSKFAAPKVTNVNTNRQISTISLLALLNLHLHNVVAANMGNGDETRILNYRTGRFATSTKVERLTMSKDQALTAYYSYMKYPYATFSDGGQQQYPRTRDPKLLISKSIKEIAAKYVSNKLRAVNV